MCSTPCCTRPPTAWPNARNIKDTSRQGRWHNQRYAKLAREVGLEVTADAKTGLSQTHLTDQAAARYAEALRDLEAALGLWRHAEPKRDGRPAPATCWPARARAGEGCASPARPWSRPRSCAARASSPSSPPNGI
jgi:hypothetical protein